MPEPSFASSPPLPAHPSWAAGALVRAFRLDLEKAWTGGMRLILSLLILTILAALAGGVAKTFLDLKLLLSLPVEVALRQFIIDTLILLAVVELFKTTLTYFTQGRVKVTFIVDTILVVMLTEVIAQWFKGNGAIQLGILGAILLTLGVMRVLTVRFSPLPGNPEEGGQELTQRQCRLNGDETEKG